MRMLAAGIVCSAALVTGLPESTADLYKLDRGHTEIGFAVKHFGLATVRGRFERFEGTIRYDSAAVGRSGVEVTIDAASLETGNGERDEALVSAAFLDVKRYPTIQFRSVEVVERAGATVAVGDLTIRGVTRRVELPFTFVRPTRAPHNGGKFTLGAEGTLTINRKDFGVNFHRVMDNGSLFVADEVRIDITAQAIRTGAAPEAGTP